MPLTRWRHVPCDHHSTTTMSSDGRRQDAPDYPAYNRTYTWHEHVYRKLTGRPTPHYIENILGLQKTNTTTTTPPAPPPPPPHHQQHQEPVSANRSPVPDMNEPLNLSIKSDTKVRSKTVKGGCCEAGTSAEK